MSTDEETVRLERNRPAGVTIFLSKEDLDRVLHGLACVRTDDDYMSAGEWVKHKALEAKLRLAKGMPPAKPNDLHLTVGVYPNGSMKTNGVTPKNLKEHIDYNLSFRPGRALFVDGVMVYAGHLDEKAMREALEIVPKIPRPTRDTAPYV